MIFRQSYMQRGCLGLPFGCGRFSVFSGSSWALAVDVITLNSSNKNIEGTVNRFSKGTSFSLISGFKYLNYNDSDKCSFWEIFLNTLTSNIFSSLNNKFFLSPARSRVDRNLWPKSLSSLIELKTLLVVEIV